jgi:hypothetical protein
MRKGLVTPTTGAHIHKLRATLASRPLLKEDLYDAYCELLRRENREEER